MMFFKYIVLFVLTLDAIACEGIEDTLNVPEDGLLNFEQLLNKYGLFPEVYYLTTEDGYILEVYNVPGDKTRPLLLSHGIFDTSCGWFLRANRSLGFMAAEQGYDVWVINYRGNRYSRNHTTLDPNRDGQFWDYSVHEMANYDLATTIDFVLNKTGQEQLSIVGFSEGTTTVFVLGSTKPEYNQKVKMFVGMAPVVFLEHVRPILSQIIWLSPIIDLFLPQNVKELAGYYSLEKAIINMLCTQLPIGYELCYYGGFNALSGINSAGIEREFFKTLIGHFPAGSSRKNLIHFAKMSLLRTFGQYDYGVAENLKVYHSFRPPVYDVSQVSMRTALVSGRNDPVSTMEDVEKLRGILPNLVEYKVAERPEFNHLDHMFAKDAPDLTYGFVLEMLEK